MHSSQVEITIEAERRDAFVDLTDDLNRAVRESGVTDGCCVAFSRHTTCALILNEWEDGVLADLSRHLDALVPSESYFAHDDPHRRTQNLNGADERRNGASHVKQVLLGATSQAIPICAGVPMLGRWQRLFLLELDDPKDRRVLFHVFGT